mmetsp:Transcript_19981/g.56608  ORF Transcript_19981/g.56608 Transcript_19981/m.56608 type:complete len:280 (-) Transcript_19981:2215-3054(-)
MTHRLWLTVAAFRKRPCPCAPAWIAGMPALPPSVASALGWQDRAFAKDASQMVAVVATMHGLSSSMTTRTAAGVWMSHAECHRRWMPTMRRRLRPNSTMTTSWTHGWTLAGSMAPNRTSKAPRRMHRTTLSGTRPRHPTGSCALPPCVFLATWSRVPETESWRRSAATACPRSSRCPMPAGWIPASYGWAPPAGICRRCTVPAPFRHSRLRWYRRHGTTAAPNRGAWTARSRQRQWPAAAACSKAVPPVPKRPAISEPTPQCRCRWNAAVLAVWDAPPS